MGKNTTKRSLLASVIIYKKDDPLGAPSVRKVPRGGSCISG